MGEWAFLGSLLDAVQLQSPLVGRLWLVLMLIFRILVLATVGGAVFEDEQEEFVCNTLQPGCRQTCYDRAFPRGLQRPHPGVPGHRAPGPGHLEAGSRCFREDCPQDPARALPRCSRWSGGRGMNGGGPGLRESAQEDIAERKLEVRVVPRKTNHDTSFPRASPCSDRDVAPVQAPYECAHMYTCGLGAALKITQDFSDIRGPLSDHALGFIQPC
ncbi:hypothetical protein PANDA_014406 [Ailuropoda melanoleuca]|uniref:Connexin N-terminal domain-containing protein n=1 Tax=Ailuropoda melanoleuca TaxID=9646 RepID=D2HR22_AILME|nr:hypothetical protein PANDA_014406 [Ailuropoda melanoleuca]